MKKLVAGIAVALLAGASSPTFAAVQTGGTPCSVTVPNFCGGFTFGLSALWWRPSTHNLDYALTFPKFEDESKAPILENGISHSVDPDYDWGYRLNIGYVFPCSGNDIVLAYTNFNHDNLDTTRNTTGAFVLFATLSSGSPLVFTTGSNEISFVGDFFAPGFGEAEDLTVKVPISTARASFDTDYQAWDLELGQYVNAGCNSRFRFFAGLRYAKLDNTLDVHYLGTGSTDSPFPVESIPGDPDTGGNANFNVASDLHVIQQSDFKGIGPRIGTNFTYHIANGFGLVAESSAALLVGQLDDLHLRDDISFVVTGVGTSGAILGETATQTSHQDVIDFNYGEATRVVPNLEGKLALDYTYSLCNCSRTVISVEAGYIATHYWDAYDLLSGTAARRDLQNGNELTSNDLRHTQDLSFNGPYISLQVKL